MRTAIHIGLILLVGVGLGVAIRAAKSDRGADGPGPNDVVYSNQNSTWDAAVRAIEYPDPIRPPEEEVWLSRFELTERSVKKISSEELLGQPYLVSFFFSTCPSICVQQNQKLKELQDEFEGEGVRFVAISVDPETDTPEKLREYAARFGADENQWLFMTGDLTYIRRIGSEIFQQPVDKKFHTERFVLVDPEGKIEGFYNWPEEVQLKKLKQKIREMIQATS
ncbi:MAG: SCO family protein [Pirellulaceae bacterium]|nr:SCO family protein [Pirellulaceae bacterium]